MLPTYNTLKKKTCIKWQCLVTARGGGWVMLKRTCSLRMPFMYVLPKKTKTMFFRSCDFIFNFFAFFSKMRQSISTLPLILFLMKFCVTSTFFCQTSPRCFSQGSPGGWIKIFMKLVDIYHRKIHKKKLGWLPY